LLVASYKLNLLWTEQFLNVYDIIFEAQKASCKQNLLYLLWTEQFLNKFVTILEAPKARDGLEYIWIHRIDGGNDVGLYYFHHWKL